MLNRRGRLREMSLNELRAEYAACTSCKCRGCAIRSKDALEFIAIREAEEAAKPIEEDNSQYDPVLLAAGIKMRAARKQHHMEPAARAALKKRFADLMEFQKTTEGIAREQSKLDRLHGIRGTVVRG